jgi:dipeptidyl aminopeptidase/acylaminoacyl peptidase
MARLGIGRAGVSRWSRWLGLWLACGMVLPLFGQGRPDIVWMQGGHGAPVRSVAFSPDGRLLASGSGRDDRTIKLWRVADGSLVRTLTGHTREVLSVSFSPDGRWLASGSGDGTIKLWRVSDGTLLQTYDQEIVWGVPSIRFSPDGQLFGYGRGDATVVVARNPFWRSGEGKPQPKNVKPQRGNTPPQRKRR